MRVQKIPDDLRFVRRQIVENDVDLLPGPALRNHFAEEIHEIGAGVARRRFSVHAPGLGVQRGVQRQRAVAVIFEPVPLGAAPLQIETSVSRTGFSGSISVGALPPLPDASRLIGSNPSFPVTWFDGY